MPRNVDVIQLCDTLERCLTDMVNRTEPLHVLSKEPCLECEMRRLKPDVCPVCEARKEVDRLRVKRYRKKRADK